MVIVTQNTYRPNESMVKTNEFSVKNYFSNPTGFFGNPPKVSDPSLKFNTFFTENSSVFTIDSLGQ